jgi:Orn/Lys/Arg decarboxylase, C-terminal domain
VARTAAGVPRDAFFAAADTATPRKAVGRISAELVTPHPPGMPAVAPGEVYTKAIVDYLEEVVANDGFVEGAADPSPTGYGSPALPKRGCFDRSGARGRFTRPDQAPGPAMLRDAAVPARVSACPSAAWPDVDSAWSSLSWTRLRRGLA